MSDIESRDIHKRLKEDGPLTHDELADEFDNVSGAIRQLWISGDVRLTADRKYDAEGTEE